MICRTYAAYTIDRVGQLTITQFRTMLEHAEAHDCQLFSLLANTIRVSVNGEKKDFQSFLDNFDIEDEKDTDDVASLNDLEDMGFDVEK